MACDGLQDRPRRVLAAVVTARRMLLLPRLEQLRSSEDHNDQVERGGYTDQRSYLVGPEGRSHACIKHSGHREHDAGPRNLRRALRPGGCGRSCCGQPGGYVGGDCG
jgi:hypothetical protein